jgi:membrane peptidoglycan carboxypeptidase
MNCAYNGAEAAARHYFHKPADALNSEEAVRLAAALPDPLDWSPRHRAESGTTPALAPVINPADPA